MHEVFSVLQPNKYNSQYSKYNSQPSRPNKFNLQSNNKFNSQHNRPRLLNDKARFATKFLKIMKQPLKLISKIISNRRPKLEAASRGLEQVYKVDNPVCHVMSCHWISFFVRHFSLIWLDASTVWVKVSTSPLLWVGLGWVGLG